MNQKKILKLIGRAYSDGEVDMLYPLLAADCEYISEYAKVTLSGADNIADRMKAVYNSLNDSCRYTYEIVKLKSVSVRGSLSELYNDADMPAFRRGLLLYQFGVKKPVAVVICMTDTSKKIKRIYLCRDKNKFDISFYAEEIEQNSPYDLPSSVKPLTTHDRLVAELQDSFSGQKLKPSKTEGGDIYIWRKADEFAKEWLPNRGYQIIESSIFEDSIGYRCNRSGFDYTIFVYAYGQEKTVHLDGEYCSRLAELPFAADSTVLILYINVHRYMYGDEVRYRIRDYSGGDRAHEMWMLSEVNGQPILDYFPRKEIKDRLWQFMYAFNREDVDVYDSIITDKDPVFTSEGLDGGIKNSLLYSALRNIHQKYGDMKLGYVRYNDVIYSSAPYIENYGFFGFVTDGVTDRITEVNHYLFEGGKREIFEFIKTDEREPDDLFSHIPKLISAEPLPSAPTERFSAILGFDNGECKKFVLPIEREKEDQEEVSFCRHIFSDGIWSSMSIVDRHSSEHREYPDDGSAIAFKNGFFLSGMRCYIESTPYSEPEHLNEIVYEDGSCLIRKLWRWNVRSMYEDKETGLLKTLIGGQAFNRKGKSVYASVDGRRLTSLDFDFVDNFKEGLARVAISKRGYGFVDRDMNLVIALKYDSAEDFENARAKVKLDDNWFFVDKTGKELKFSSAIFGDRYEDVREYSEGLCRVSTLKLRFMDMAYHSDYEHIAGIWGFVDEDGREVITPQYIYAHDFENGVAIAAKGKWTIDPKWDNEHNQGRYWTEYELWGGIDKNGNEVIPFIFDEIQFIEDCDDMYIAHIGGWKDGHWGIIDKSGKWIAEPTFEGFGYEYSNGLITFYGEDKWSSDDPLMGIYDLNQKRVLFEPQFSDVDFLKNGDISIEVFDEELGRSIEKIVDRNGKERFKSVYSSICTWQKPYEVVIKENGTSRRGLIDENGTVILPCIYEDVTLGGIIADRELIICKKDGKEMVVDYNNNIVIPPKYLEIHGIKNPLWTVRVGENDDYTEGLISLTGDMIIPAKYQNIEWCRDGKHFFGCAEGCCEMYSFEEKSKS